MVESHAQRCSYVCIHPKQGNDIPIWIRQLSDSATQSQLNPVGIGLNCRSASTCKRNIEHMCGMEQNAVQVHLSLTSWEQFPWVHCSTRNLQTERFVRYIHYKRHSHLERSQGEASQLSLHCMPGVSQGGVGCGLFFNPFFYINNIPLLKFAVIIFINTFLF